jgi:hypothetical protein
MTDELGLSVRDIAAALGIDARAVERWRSTDTLPQRETRQRWNQLLAVIEHLEDTFKIPEARRTWLHSPSDYLGGLTRAEVLCAGRFDRVEADLVALDAGIFN